MYETVKIVKLIIRITKKYRIITSLLRWRIDNFSKIDFKIIARSFFYGTYLMLLSLTKIGILPLDQF